MPEIWMSKRSGNLYLLVGRGGVGKDKPRLLTGNTQEYKIFKQKKPMNKWLTEKFEFVSYLHNDEAVLNSMNFMSAQAGIKHE